jgi:DNA-binding response OmpR family regulator
MEPVFYLENDENDFVLLDIAFRKIQCRNYVRWFKSSDDLKGTLSSAAFDRLPKLILLDLKLDGESGLETMEWIMRQPHLVGIPTFIFSSGRLEQEIVTALKINASAYLFKPSKLADWIELVSQLKSMIDADAPLRTFEKESYFSVA